MKVNLTSDVLYYLKTNKVKSPKLNEFLIELGLTEYQISNIKMTLYFSLAVFITTIVFLSRAILVLERDHYDRLMLIINDQSLINFIFIFAVFLFGYRIVKTTKILISDIPHRNKFNILKSFVNINKNIFMINTSYFITILLIDLKNIFFNNTLDEKFISFDAFLIVMTMISIFTYFLNNSLLNLLNKYKIDYSFLNIKEHKEAMIDRINHQIKDLNDLYINKNTLHLKRGYVYIDFKKSNPNKIIININGDYKPILDSDPDYDLCELTCTLTKLDIEGLKTILKVIEQSNKIKDDYFNDLLSKNLNKESDVKFFNKQLEKNNRLNAA